MSDVRIIAIDPGERVGWARAEVSEGELVDIVYGVHALKDFALKLYESRGTYDVIVYETWRLYPHMAKRLVGNDMQPSQLIGMIRLIAWITGTQLVSQGANIKRTAMQTMPAEFREVFERSTEQHDKDAGMHLWHWYWKNYIARNPS